MKLSVKSSDTLYESCLSLDNYSDNKRATVTVVPNEYAISRDGISVNNKRVLMF